MQKDFFDSYRSTQWQEKKNKILTRDNYTCAICGKHGDEHTLMHVHHLTYKNCKNNHAWDVPDSDLITLCEDCHKKVHSKEPFSSSLENYFYLESQHLFSTTASKEAIIQKGTLSFIAKNITLFGPLYTLYNGFVFISEGRLDKADINGALFTTGVISEHLFYNNKGCSFLGMDINSDYVVFPPETLIAKFVYGLLQKIKESAKGETNPCLSAFSYLFLDDYAETAYYCYLIASRMLGWNPLTEEAFTDNSALNSIMTIIMGPMWIEAVESVYPYDDKEISTCFKELYNDYKNK